MKLIDSEGKIFGIVNVIDLAVFIVLVLLGIGYYSYVYQMSSPERLQLVDKNITLRMTYPEIAAVLAEGDRESMGNGQMVTITGIAVSREGDAPKALLNLTVRAEQRGTEYRHGNRYGNHRIKIGDGFQFDLPQSKVEGIIVAIE